MIELLSCPFCGSNRVDYNSMQQSKNGWILFLKCPDCKTSFRALEHIYNRRVYPAEIENVLKVATEFIGIFPDPKHKDLSIKFAHLSDAVLAYSEWRAKHED